MADVLDIGGNKWTKLQVNGEIWVADFCNTHCTGHILREFDREQIVAGAVLKMPDYYDDVTIVALCGDNVEVRVGRRDLTLEPGKRADGPKHPLDYAWSQLELCLV